MRRYWLLVFVVLSAAVASVTIVYSAEKAVYVKPETENLRKAPDGDVLATLNRGTKLEVLEEGDKWLKVRVTGWIWKASTSDTKPKVKAKAKPGGRKYVGSVKSDKYHYPTCRWAKKIKPYNEIWFGSREEPSQKGYRPCKVCRP